MTKSRWKAQKPGALLLAVCLLLGAAAVPALAKEETPAAQSRESAPSVAEVSQPEAFQSEATQPQASESVNVPSLSETDSTVISQTSSRESGPG